MLQEPESGGFSAMSSLLLSAIARMSDAGVGSTGMRRWIGFILVASVCIVSGPGLKATVCVGLARPGWVVIAADSVQVNVQPNRTVERTHVCKVGISGNVVTTVAGLVHDGDFDAMVIAQTVAARNADAFHASADFRSEMVQRLPAIVARHQNDANYKDWTASDVPVVSVMFGSFTRQGPQLESCIFRLEPSGRPRVPTCARSSIALNRIDRFYIGRVTAVSDVLRDWPEWADNSADDPRRFVEELILTVSGWPGVTDVGPPITIVRLDSSGIHLVESGVCHFGS
jgi:hypothetical protein